MTLALDTRFDSLATIDMDMTGQAGYDWYTRLPDMMPGAQQSPTATLSIVTEDGESFLRIDPDESNANWTIATIDPATGNGRTWRYGYFEARLRFAQVPAPNDWTQLASWPSWWLTSPVAWQGPTGTRFPEIDILEQMAGPNILSGTIHEWTQNSDGGHVYTKHDAHRSMDGWHTYGLRWEPGRVSWIFDGKFVMSRTYGPTVTPEVGGFTDWAGAPDQPMQSLPTGTFSVLDTATMTPIIGAGVDAPMDVSHVRVWALPA